MEFISTNRGARALVYEGYKYQINRRGLDGRIFWRCSKSRTCSGTLTTLNGEIISNRADQHSHPADDSEISACKTLETIKTTIRESIDPVPSIYQRSMIEISARYDRDAIAAHFPSFPTIKSALYRIRRQRLPPLPQSRSEVHFHGEWARTYNGSQFLIAEQGGDEDKIIIFTTTDNMRYLSEVERIYMDGTFQTCPSLFYQIFTIHAFKSGKQFPLVYCLLPGKSRSIYLKALELLILKARQLGYNINPNEILTDFEIAIIQAIQLIFPSTTVKGCYFHFTQAINRKINTMGLQTLYKQDAVMNQFIRKTAALAFIPADLVFFGWNMVKTMAPIRPEIHEFLNYFEDTWLVGQFPPVLWNVFNQDAHNPRTNNHVEGWHNKLKRIARKAHPNIYEIVTIFKQEQAFTEVSIAQLASGATLRKRANKSVQKDNRIQKLKEDFVANLITLGEYLQGLSLLTIF